MSREAANTAPLVDALLAFGHTVPRAKLFPTVVPDAAAFALSNPFAFAFALAASLDRGTRADIIWTIPYDINARLGHLDPYRIRDLSSQELNALISELPRKPRYTNDAPRTIHELSQLVCDEYGGNAAAIWEGRRAHDVKQV